MARHTAQGSLAIRPAEGDTVEARPKRGLAAAKPAKTAGSDDTLTASEARKLRRAVKQAKEGKTKPWSVIKDELGL